MAHSDDAKRDGAALCERICARHAAILRWSPAGSPHHDLRVPMRWGSAELVLACRLGRTCPPDVA